MKKFLLILILLTAGFFGYRYWKKRKEGEESGPEFEPGPVIPKGFKFKKLSDSQVDAYAKNGAQILPSSATTPETKNSYLKSLLGLQKESLINVARRFQLSYSVAGKPFADAIRDTIGADPGVKTKVISTLKKIL